MNARLVITATTGWLVALLLVATISVAYRLRHGSVRWRRPHYWIAYTIVAMVIVHLWASMTRGIVTHAERVGVYVATAALVLVLTQLAAGLTLRRRLDSRSRGTARRIHFWIMLGIALTALVHIGFDSVLLGTFHG
jgi:hypothetical protein